MATRREILMKARQARQQYQGQADPLNSSPDGTVPPPRPTQTMIYECGAKTAPVLLKQPEAQKKFLRKDKNSGD
jgi:hypothetical protein